MQQIDEYQAFIEHGHHTKGKPPDGYKIPTPDSTPESNPTPVFKCWKDLELVQQIDEYQAFIEHGHHTKGKPPDGYKKICVHVTLLDKYKFKFPISFHLGMDFPHFEYDWSKTVYGELEELKPTDATEPLGQVVILTQHDVAMGRSVTGILHLLNKTPLDWCSKKQVETATYGSEFVADLTCVEHIIDLHNTLWHLGFTICKKSYMFGNNQSVINSSMQAHAKLHKCLTMLFWTTLKFGLGSRLCSFGMDTLQPFWMMALPTKGE
jgi:hypothetical protein